MLSARPESLDGLPELLRGQLVVRVLVRSKEDRPEVGHSGLKDALEPRCYDLQLLVTVKEVVLVLVCHLEQAHHPWAEPLEWRSVLCSQDQLLEFVRLQLAIGIPVNLRDLVLEVVGRGPELLPQDLAERIELGPVKVTVMVLVVHQEEVHHPWLHLCEGGGLVQSDGEPLVAGKVHLSAGDLALENRVKLLLGNLESLLEHGLDRIKLSALQHPVLVPVRPPEELRHRRRHEVRPDLDEEVLQLLGIQLAIGVGV
mmetsp:Transcript_10617/g.31176  ORF Transcript_10617/g.31176 Transcript_10617/m.31176 type:complete len:256 (+) Transcript_10617:301-1068(+)